MIIGSYLCFHTTMMNIKTLYKIKTKQAVFNDKGESDEV